MLAGLLFTHGSLRRLLEGRIPILRCVLVRTWKSVTSPHSVSGLLEEFFVDSSGTVFSSAWLDNGLHRMCQSMEAVGKKFTHFLREGRHAVRILGSTVDTCCVNSWLFDEFRTFSSLRWTRILKLILVLLSGVLYELRRMEKCAQSMLQLGVHSHLKTGHDFYESDEPGSGD